MKGKILILTICLCLTVSIAFAAVYNFWYYGESEVTESGGYTPTVIWSYGESVIRNDNSIVSGADVYSGRGIGRAIGRGIGR